MIRRSLRRPSDPSGKTTAAGTAFRKPDDLAPLLPAGLPRFKAGDRPLPGVDWELVELLGVGGFGEVWKARNPLFDDVAAGGAEVLPRSRSPRNACSSTRRKSSIRSCSRASTRASCRCCTPTIS